MSYLRFSPEDYHTLCRLCSPHLTFTRDLPAFQRLLLFALSDTRPALARRVGELDRGQLRTLHDHFAARPSTCPAKPQGHGLSPREVRVLGRACRSYPFAVRFLKPFRANLVAFLKDIFPALAHKVRDMSDEEFTGLHEQLTRRKKGSA